MRRALRLLLGLAVAALLLAADAGTKAWAEGELRRRGARSYLDGHLTLRYQTNSGIAFGLFQPHLHPRKRAWLITYGAAVAAGVALVLGFRTLAPGPHPRRLELAGLCLLLAGAAGNLLDRIRRGAVIDFIVIDPWPSGSPAGSGGAAGFRWPAFNLADAYLAVGLVMCAIVLVAAYRRQRRELA